MKLFVRDARVEHRHCARVRGQAILGVALPNARRSVRLGEVGAQARELLHALDVRHKIWLRRCLVGVDEERREHLAKELGHNGQPRERLGGKRGEELRGHERTRRVGRRQCHRGVLGRAQSKLTVERHRREALRPAGMALEPVIELVARERLARERLVELRRQVQVAQQCEARHPRRALDRAVAERTATANDLLAACPVRAPTAVGAGPIAAAMRASEASTEPVARVRARPVAGLRRKRALMRTTRRERPQVLRASLLLGSGVAVRAAVRAGSGRCQTVRVPTTAAAESTRCHTPPRGVVRTRAGVCSPIRAAATVALVALGRQLGCRRARRHFALSGQRLTLLAAARDVAAAAAAQPTRTRTQLSSFFLPLHPHPRPPHPSFPPLPAAPPPRVPCGSRSARRREGGGAPCPRAPKREARRLDCGTDSNRGNGRNGRNACGRESTYENPG